MPSYFLLPDIVPIKVLGEIFLSTFVIIIFQPRPGFTMLKHMTPAKPNDIKFHTSLLTSVTYQRSRPIPTESMPTAVGSAPGIIE